MVRDHEEVPLVVLTVPELGQPALRVWFRQPSGVTETLLIVGPTFDQFAAARTGALLRYAHVLTGDRARAEDLVQDALAGAFKHWGRIGHQNPEGYVRRSILNGYLGRWRRIGRWEQPDAPLPERTSPDLSEMVVQRDAMKRALSGLPPRMRAVLVLRFYEDMTEKQTAVAMGISVGAVKSATARALGKLRSDEAVTKETVR